MIGVENKLNKEIEELELRNSSLIENFDKANLERRNIEHELKSEI